MLSIEEVRDRYKIIRQNTAKFSSKEILLIEDCIKEITKTCLDVLYMSGEK